MPLAQTAGIDCLQENFVLVQQTIRQVRKTLSGHPLRSLPRLGAPPHGSRPRVCALAFEVIQGCEGSISSEEITRAVQAYQKIGPLTLGELRILRDILRLEIVERLSQALDQVMRTTPFTSLRGEETGTYTKAGAVVAGCVRNLQVLEALDWREFLRSVSHVERILQNDPIEVYTQMDPSTQDSYSTAVEELAGSTGQSEVAVAAEAVRLAQSRSPNGSRSHCSTNSLLRYGHVGYYLLDAGRPELEARLGYRPTRKMRFRHRLFEHADLLYLGTIAVATALILAVGLGYSLAVGGTLVQSIGACLLALAPSLGMAIALVNGLTARWVPSRTLPKMDFRKDIPAEYRALVAIPALLADASEVETLLHRIELNFLGNEDRHLCIALLTDFVDAPHEKMPGDANLLETLVTGIQTLNEKYGQTGIRPFYLFHRDRSWNPKENCWLGWERKRGKLVELNCLLRGQKTSYRVQIGDLNVLSEVRYVITLDMDTKLPHEAASRLVATLAHPLNQAEFDPQTGKVTAGYTVLQPRIATSQANPTLFTWAYSGNTGCDLYAHAFFDLYQDLFAEGNYVGKGIYDVDAFTRSLEGKIPDNMLISHDLLEGVLGRAGMITDLTLFEDFPPSYLCYMRRFHRWVRGDWQLLPWLFPKVPHAVKGLTINTFSLIDRWKVVDNLWRSLYAPFLFAFLISTWLVLPGSAWLWTLGVILILSTSLLTGIATRVTQQLRRVPTDSPRSSLRSQLVRHLLFLVFLPYETLVALDAIGRTLIRLFIIRRHLLRWTPSAHTILQVGQNATLAVTWKEMAGAPMVSAGLAWLVASLHSTALPVALPFLLAWLMSPHVAHWLNRALYRTNSPLPAERLQRLRELACRTWFYFESFVGPETNWLPPDHIQEEPARRVIYLTSPTNIGFTLLATLSAYDLGYIGPLELSFRLRKTFETLEKLERHRGHFLNWYDTCSLEPVVGRYVSVVDSGNLAGCLLALKRGCQEPMREPVCRLERWRGLLDTLEALNSVLAENDIPNSRLVPLVTETRRRLAAATDAGVLGASSFSLIHDGIWSDLDHTLDASIHEYRNGKNEEMSHRLQAWRGRLHLFLESMEQEQAILFPWLSAIDAPPDLFVHPETDPKIARIWRELLEVLPPKVSLGEAPRACESGLELLSRFQIELDALGEFQPALSARAWCNSLSHKLELTCRAATELSETFRDLSMRSEGYFQAMDFGFLFDETRKLFPIGFNVTQDTSDKCHYDLLASEARLASLVAIAKGDVPQSHWLHLARPVTQTAGGQALLSWNGSMFEYLLPGLLLRNYPGTLLHQTAQAAVAAHIGFGRQRGIPWGISESNCCQFDLDHSYRYCSFGIQALSLRQILSEERVITPYASLLALSLRPRAVMYNVEYLCELGMLSPYGFYEAIDFAADPVTQEPAQRIAYVYMSHHQGMIMMALTNYLRNEVMVQRFHADPRVESVELILQE
jgi:cyclic beta-1,2-glucan synthetase